MTMTDKTTLTMTWTLHLSGPLTEEEKGAIIGNMREHIFYERDYSRHFGLRQNRPRCHGYL
jgi:hypothetical protein